MNSYPNVWQPLERTDRHIRRALLRMPATASRHHVSFMLEEALRLATLPGEEHGFVYYFRRVSLHGLLYGAPRNLWLDQCQSMLSALADRAVHGASVSAATAEAVYFVSQQEAVEWLLRRLLRLHATPEWFVPMICTTPPGSSRAEHITALIELLRQLPAAWFAAASAMSSVLASDSDAAMLLLASIPKSLASSWLQELGSVNVRGSQSVAMSTDQMQFLRRVTKACRQDASPSAAEQEDFDGQPKIDSDPRVLWLAAMVLLAEHPSELARGTVVAHARALLQQLAMPATLHAVPHTQDAESVRSSRDVQITPAASIRSIPATVAETKSSRPNVDSLRPISATLFDYSQPSAAAGLYFLLNVLSHLGIASVLDAVPALLVQRFIPRLVLSLARAAKVPLDDTSLLWIRAQRTEEVSLGASDSVPAVLCWPRHLPHIPSAPALEEKLIQTDDLVRLWTLAVRRWCWRTAHITLREVVCRPGRILVSRTDLDVSLPIDSADLRLRRVGMDLDPGWLPWFGRVVRFHYTLPMLHIDPASVCIAVTSVDAGGTA